MNEGTVERPPILFRWLGWGIRRIGWGTLGMLALLLLVLYGMIISLSELVRGLEIGFLFLLSSLGLTSAWGLARSRLRAGPATLLLLALGLAIILGRAGGLFPTTYRSLMAMNEWTLAWQRWYPSAPLPEMQPLLAAAGELWGRLQPLLARTLAWLRGVAGGSAVFDPVAAQIAWSFATWAASAWAGWVLRRWNAPLPAILPASALFSFSLAYLRTTPIVMLPMLASTFLLMAWTSYRGRERRWQSAGVDFSEEVHFDISVAALILIMVVTTLAAISPSLSLRNISAWFERFSPPAAENDPAVGESLGLKPRPTVVARPNPLARRRSGGLPRSHLLGTGPELSQQVVMHVETGEIPPGPPEIVLSSPAPRYYWRSIIYDIYTGQGWATGPTYASEYPPEGVSLVTNDVGLAVSGRRFVQQEIHMAGDASSEGGWLLHATGALLGVDRAFRASWRAFPTGEDPSLLAGDLFGATLPENEYRAVSLVVQPKEEQLQAASSGYPDWVREHYLTLPESVPLRILNLARNLTATGATPYDRAKAIETYLRAYPYNLDIPLPPPGQDVVDYFLFDLKQGYCDYYATAMVVLARAAGLPARLVMGYATGSYDAYTARYVVTEADAHSWPEIYFEGLGWVEFEPTAYRPIFDRSGVAEQPQESANLDDLVRPRPRPDLTRLLLQAGTVLGVLFLLATLFALAASLVDRRILDGLPPERAAARLYRRLRRVSQSLGVPTRAGDTPFEFARAFARRMLSLASSQRWRARLSPSAQEASQITDLYARATYAPHPPTAEEQRGAISAWFRLRRRLWLARLTRLFQQK